MTDSGNQTPRQMMSRDQLMAIVYQDHKESQRATFGVSAEYGKWLVSSLLLVNGGALAGLFSYLDGISTDPKSLTQFAWPVWAFVGGIILALLSGLCAWMNWSMHSENHRLMASFEMLWNPDFTYPAEVSWTGITVTYWFALILGLASAIAPVIGASLVLHQDFLTALISGSG